MHRGTLKALRYAETLSKDITAVHVSIDDDEAAKLQQKWETWGDGVRSGHFRIAVPPDDRTIVDLCMQELTQNRLENEVITIVIPQFIPKRFWANALHMRTADTLRKVLMGQKNIVIVEVPYQVD